MNKLTGVMLFFAGAAVGALAAYRAAKIKFERIADEEIASVKEVFTARRSGVAEPSVDEADIAKPGGGRLPEDKTECKPKPYVITLQEFMEIDGYSLVTLTYYADGVLVNEEDEPMNANKFGDLKELFDEGEDDSIYFRDDAAKVDYEILRDGREYKRRK